MGSDEQQSAGFAPVTRGDLFRIESKVDKLTAAIETLVRVEERQTNQGRRVGDLEAGEASLRMRIEAVREALTKQHTDALDAMNDKLHEHKRELDAWKNRGIGAWILATVAFTVYINFFK